MDDFSSSMLSALGGGPYDRKESFVGLPPDGEGGPPYEDPQQRQNAAQAGGFFGDLISALMLKKTYDRMKAHAGWLQDIAAAPPHPAWVDVQRGTGPQKRS